MTGRPYLLPFLLAAVLFVPGMVFVGADDLSISGADARFLAVTGAVDLFVVATDESGESLRNLSVDDFVLTDAPVGKEPGEAVPITGFSAAGERKDGISFMMLIDDSGSMYDGPGGGPSPTWEESRAALARREARRFLDELGGSLDRAGLAVFGTRYRVLAGPRTDRATLIERLGVSPEPESEEAYTELYASIAEAAESMSDQRGRRIVILFSDGENYPYFQQSGELHPDYGEKRWIGEEALKELREEAVTLYAVRFGPRRDDELARIAGATGGLVFDVDAEEGLSGLYGSIRERVLAEYRLSYRPRPTGATETMVNLEFSDGSASSRIVYPSGFVFGAPARMNTALLSLIALPVAVLLLIFLARLRSAAKAEKPSLDRLRPVGGGAATVALSTGKTVISPGVAGAATTILPESAPGSDAAGSGSSAVPGSGTIIVEKGRDGKWRASSGEGVVVNNRKTDATVLENGDVIKAGEELIVFNDGES